MLTITLSFPWVFHEMAEENKSQTSVFLFYHYFLPGRYPLESRSRVASNTAIFYLAFVKLQLVQSYRYHRSKSYSLETLQVPTNPLQIRSCFSLASMGTPSFRVQIQALVSGTKLTDTYPWFSVFVSTYLVFLFQPTIFFSLLDERESVQKKTFQKWVNSHLVRVSCRIGDLYVDLRDGKMLLKLLEVLSGERLVRTCKFKQ